MALYLIDQYKKGNYPLEKIIVQYDIKDFEKAMKDTKEGRAVKAVLTWK
jgi:Zn-dependent alcohol dehydrogenase